MVQLIVGNKGKGKTKYLLEKVNTEVKNVSGNIVYLDKSTKQMFELNNKVRLINVTDFLIDSSEAFLGFIFGIISQDNDLEKVYLDSFLKVACLEDADVKPVLDKLAKISEKILSLKTKNKTNIKLEESCQKLDSIIDNLKELIENSSL